MFQAFTSLMLQFEKKANDIDSSINWYQSLDAIFTLSLDDILNKLAGENPQWINELDAGIQDVDKVRENFPAGESSTAPVISNEKRIEMINADQKKIAYIMKNVMIGLADPKIGQIDGFEKAYKKFEGKKLSKKLLDKVKKELPAMKTKHDEIAEKISSQISSFAAVRDFYMNKLKSLNKKSEASFPTALSDIQDSQRTFLVGVNELSKNVMAHVSQALKCAELILEKTGLHFNPESLEKKLKEKAEKERKAVEKEAKKKNKHGFFSK